MDFYEFIGSVACEFYKILRFPLEYFNHLCLGGIDMIVWVFPEIPDRLTLGALISGLLQYLPKFLWPIVLEIFQGIQGLLIIFLLFKLIKYLPFF